MLSTLSSPDLPAFLSSLPALAGSVEGPPVLLRLDQQDTTWGGAGPCLPVLAKTSPWPSQLWSLVPAILISFPKLPC